MPWSAWAGGQISFAGSVDTTKLAQYRPAASLITVTVDGTDGSVRDQRTFTGPILGRFSFLPGVIDQRHRTVRGQPAIGQDSHRRTSRSLPSDVSCELRCVVCGAGRPSRGRDASPCGSRAFDPGE